MLFFTYVFNDPARLNCHGTKYTLAVSMKSPVPQHSLSLAANVIY